RLAGTEAYLPILEILEDLLQGDNDRSISGSMKELAPDWYGQVAPPLSGEGARTGADTKPVSQESLKRQLAAFLKDISRRRPLIFFFDDFQWADASTVDLVAYLASRFDSIHILVLVTYRPGELLLAKHHPFVQTKFELQSRNQCSDLVLDFLAREDVAAYLD